MLDAAHIDPMSTRASFSDQPVPSGSALRVLRSSAESAGIDPVAELYNEALNFSAEGQLREARERLQVLLALAPEDGEARLLLAKIFVAGQKWNEALATLDEATQAGNEVPASLRSAIDEHLRADRAAEAETRAARSTRDQSEVKALRQEARLLRSDKAQLTGELHEQERETRKWATITTVVSSLFILFLLVNLLFGGGSSSEVTSSPVVADGSPVATEGVDAAGEPVAADPGPATPDTVADRVFEVLQSTEGLDRLTVSATAENGIILSGTVPTYRSLKRAEELVGRVDGVTGVETTEVENAARTRGTTYTVASGDTLSEIALDHYGTTGLTSRILSANQRTLRSAASLQIGQELVIPAVE